MIIGSPGSGKSRLSKKLAKAMHIPVLHLDYIYHIDNFHQISREELKSMVTTFAQGNEQFIIDGNYNGTMEWRTRFCDTIILLDIETEICVSNVLRRMNEGVRDDMAPGFDNAIMDDEFLEFVKNFKRDKIPGIYELLEQLDLNKIVLKDYEEVNQFLASIKSNQKHV